MKEMSLTNEQIGSLCASLAYLMHAGIGTADALVLLEQDENRPALKKLLAELAAQVDNGMSLAQAVQESGAFPSYVCTLLEVGQKVGKTENTLFSLARYYEERAKLENQLHTALLYPAMLLLVLLAVTTALLVWVLPVFENVYRRLGSGLTGIAGSLLTFGQGLGKALPVILLTAVLAGIALCVPGVRRYMTSFGKKHLSDRGILGKIHTARYIQALTLALGSGQTTQEAALLAGALAGGGAPAFEKRCDTCLAALENGESLPKALAKASLLDAGNCRLLEAGIRSGQSDRVLESISARLLEDSEAALAAAAGKIEPCVVAVLCGVIALILLSVMLPLMQIMTAIG